VSETLTVEPIRWRDGALELLDQRRLPAAEQWRRCECVEDVAEAIESLAVRGAPAIGIAAAYGLALAARGQPADVLALRVEEAARRLQATRPTAVNLAWALARGRRALAEDRDLLDLARALHREQRDADRTLSVCGAALFAPGDRVLTHCNTGALATGGTGTALGVIGAAFAVGRVAHVWACETRPLLQGARLTAWELQRAGIPYALVTDSSAGLLMARGLVDRVVVGADRIAANGDVANKVGTYAVAALAARHDVPFYVAAPLSTLDAQTASGADIPLERRAPEEVLTFAGGRVAPEGAAAENWAFDVTPAELVRAIVTEAGVLEPPLDRAIARTQPGALRSAPA
jgi:methylthioribose-1-phosphate isomerase